MKSLIHLLCSLGIVFLAILGWSRHAYGQRLHTRTYSELDGMGSSTIYTIAQAHDGRICVGTRTGVKLYDGTTWESMSFPGIPSNDRLEVATSKEGALVAVEFEEPHRVFEHRHGEWVSLPNAMTAETKGAQLGAIAAIGSGSNLKLLLCMRQAPPLLWTGEQWSPVAYESKGSPHLVEVSAGRFLLMSVRAIFELDPHHDLPVVERITSPPDARFLTMAKAPDSEDVRILGENLYGTLSGSTFEVDEDAEVFRPPTVNRLRLAVADARGGLYAGSPVRLHYYHPLEGSKQLNRKNGFYSSTMTCAMRDREGLLWVACYQGLTKVYPSDWVGYNSLNGLADNEVTAVLELQDGVIFLAHPDSISILSDPIRTTEVIAPDDPELLITQEPQRFMSAVELDDGDILLAARTNGLQRYSREQDTFTTVPPPNSIDQEVCANVHRDAEGRILAIYGNRIFSQHQDSWIELEGPPALEMGGARQVSDGEYGAYLVTTGRYGVLEVGVPEPRAWSHPSDRIANNVVCVSKRPDGTYWAGTKAGLHLLDGDSLLTPVDIPGLRVARPVYFITDDSRGNTWIGLDNGVIRWTGEEASHFTYRDGLLGTETNRAAGLCDSKGRMWIGTDRGVNVFDPTESLAHTTGPLLDVLTLNGNSSDEETNRDGRNGPERTQGRHAVVFELKTLSFVDEDRVSHRTWLEGFEEVWTEWAVLPSPHLVYPNLPPGRYRLHAAAKDVMGGQSEVVTTQWITIVPPLWARTWFVALCIVGLLAIITGAVLFIAKGRFARQLEATVTERTLDLALEKRRLETTLSHICDGVVLLDQDGRIAYWNRAAEEITGWSATESVGLGIQERFGVPDVGPRRSQGHATVNTLKGHGRILEATTAPIIGQPGSRSRVIAFRDITERQQAEKDLERARQLDSLGKLAGGIAHDFNNLLTVMTGNLSLFELDSNAGDSAHQRLDSINAAVNQARGLTRQLITFSEGGEPLRAPGEIGPLLRETAKLIVLGPDVECTLQIAPDLHLVEMDSAQISQVFHNLLLNARQAMGDEGRITIRAHNHSAPSSHGPVPQVVVEVADTGPGIGSGVLPLVFEPYFSTKQEGTGLGLAMAHSIVTRHGGSLRVESENGKGSLFRLVLPATLEELPKPLGSEGTIARDKSKPLSILVMDDEEGVREVLQSLLENIGHRCTTTPDGHEAVQEYHRAQDSPEPFDLVILDLTVPRGVGGKQALTEMKKLDPQVRAIAMSGYANEPILARHEDYGFCGRLSKPYGMDELNGVIRSAMDHPHEGQFSTNTGFAT